MPAVFGGEPISIPASRQLVGGSSCRQKVPGPLRRHAPDLLATPNIRLPHSISAGPAPHSVPVCPGRTCSRETLMADRGASGHAAPSVACLAYHRRVGVGHAIGSGISRVPAHRSAAQLANAPPAPISALPGYWGAHHRAVRYPHRPPIWPRPLPPAFRGHPSPWLLESLRVPLPAFLFGPEPKLVVIRACRAPGPAMRTIFAEYLGYFGRERPCRCATNCGARHPCLHRCRTQLHGVSARPRGCSGPPPRFKYAVRRPALGCSPPPSAPPAGTGPRISAPAVARRRALSCCSPSA